ncbi:hypothetical protein H4R34_006058 [Dimargaris verticillata]|uniref:Zinc/iron permease n=1 Tax=Dimargaris verticillata TaxID=2761393 RepID=A0A9W8B2C3_9FUNG|nr:hypothetical protein H4R34_006058 [Dimargaris verticillata]
MATIGLAAAHDEDSLECDAGAEDDGDYDVGLHIWAIVLVLVVSAVGAVAPIVGTRYPRLRIPPMVLEIGKHFGTGVVLATGFIHLLPDAQANLTDPCLPSGIREYDALAGVVTMVAACFFHLVEFLANMYSVGHSHSHGPAHAPPPPSQHQQLPPLHMALSSTPTQVEAASDNKANGNGTWTTAANRHHVSSESSLAAPFDEKLGHNDAEDTKEITTSRRISTYMLEFGIALHSIFVGLSLGTADGTEFVTLLIALCFHQFFEGIALGSRIAELPAKSVWKPVCNAVLVASTTPLGAVLGMAIRSVYRARSETTLIIQGILYAISSGMLIYTGLVNLIAEEFAHPSFMALPGRLKFMYIVTMYLGAAGMGLVGLWA